MWSPAMHLLARLGRLLDCTDTREVHLAHDSVLLTLEGWIARHLDSHNSKPLVDHAHPHISQSFVRPGKTRRTRNKSKPQHLLSKARDWVLLVDYTHDKMVLPEFIYVTNKRPDIVIYSRETCHVMLIELTCPAEEGILPAQVRKKARYTPLKESRLEISGRSS